MRCSAAVAAALGFVGTCLASPDDLVALMQREVQFQELNPPSLLEVDTDIEHKPQLEGNDTSASSKSKATKYRKKEFNPFKDMISTINDVIDSVKEGLETSTRAVVHQAAAEMEQAGRELTNDLQKSFNATMKMTVASALSADHEPEAGHPQNVLLQLGEELDHKPTANESASPGKAKSKRYKAELNPFKGMISTINELIDSVKDGLETSTRQVVHQAAAEMEKAGRELTSDLQKSFNATMRMTVSSAMNADHEAEVVHQASALQKELNAASLLQIMDEDVHKTKQNETSNSSKRKVKREFNLFKDMISTINQVIDSVKDGLETSTRQVVHEAAAEMERAGRELTNDLQKSFNQTMKMTVASALNADHEEAPSLLQFQADLESEPKQNETSKAKKYRKKEFNPFKDMISTINQVIDSVKDGLETSTRQVVHEAAAEMEKAGRELTNDLQKSFNATMKMTVSSALNAGEETHPVS